LWSHTGLSHPMSQFQLLFLAIHKAPIYGNEITKLRINDHNKGWNKVWNFFLAFLFFEGTLEGLFWNFFLTFFWCRAPLEELSLNFPLLGFFFVFITKLFGVLLHGTRWVNSFSPEFFFIFTCVRSFFFV